MSILIKGIEMPQKKAIAVVIHPDGTAYSTEMFAGVCTEYLADCTAIPVPPHGDLIDRDVAYDKIAEQEGGNYVDMDAVGMGLNETPVIIPEDDAWPEWRTQVLGIRQQEEE